MKGCGSRQSHLSAKYLLFKRLIALIVTQCKSLCRTKTQCTTTTHHSHTRRHADVCTTYAHRNGLPRFVERPVCLVCVNISSGTISVLLREEIIISECSPVMGYSPKCTREIMFYPNYLFFLFLG